MKINEKNNKASKNSNIDDKQISKDFSEIFDISENNEDLSTLFIDARVKKGFTQEDVSKILKVRVSAIQQIETGKELQSLGSAYSLGFLRSYAKLVDLEPEDIVKNHKNERNTNKHDSYLDFKKLDTNASKLSISWSNLMPAFLTTKQNAT